MDLRSALGSGVAIQFAVWWTLVSQIVHARALNHSLVKFKYVLDLDHVFECARDYTWIDYVPSVTTGKTIPVRLC